MDSFWQDLRFGLRSLKRSRGIIGIAVLSLAIGIGATTAIFSMVDVFMIRPLPYPEADRLYALRFANAERGISQGTLSVPDYMDLKEQSRTMTLAGTASGVFNLSGEFEAERLEGTYVTPGFFEVLGVGPLLGRAFVAEEGVPGRERVVVISHELWERRFGMDPTLVGRSIVLDGTPHTVVGVMPPRFWYIFPHRDVWAPRAISGQESRESYTLSVLARLDEGTTPEQALEDANRIWAAIGQIHPETSSGNMAELRTLHEAAFPGGFQSGSWICMVSVTFLLLIACANVANLLLTHAAGRDREVALRGALGAHRVRIVRQFLTEAGVVALLGGLLGIGLAIFGIRALVANLPADFPRVHDIALNGRALLFTAVVTMTSGLLFGLAPALQSVRGDLMDGLKEGGRGGAGARGGRLRKALVVGEMALALVLLVSSMLLVQGFHRLRLADMGFDRSDVLAMRVLLPQSQYPEASAANDFYTGLAARLRALPGVEQVGGTSVLPAQGSANTYYVLGEEDYEDRAARRLTGYRWLYPGFFEAMDVPILRGRSLEETDRVGSPLVAVVNETLARKHWPDGNPIGQVITTGSGSREIVGVVADIRDPTLDQAPAETVFFSALQSHRTSMDWAIEASVPLASLVEPVREAVREMDPTIPAHDVMSMDALIDLSIGGFLTMAALMGLVAILALVLALGGVYGVVAYGVSQRTRELGIRMSLGARRGEVLGMVMRQGAVMAGIGIVAGIGLALAVTRGLSFFLFGVNPFDPLTYGLTSLILLGAGVVATVVPARRATRVDPVVALRAD